MNNCFIIINTKISKVQLIAKTLTGAPFHSFCIKNVLPIEIQEQIWTKKIKNYCQVALDYHQICKKTSPGFHPIFHINFPVFA